MTRSRSIDRALGGADRAAQRKREELERRARRDTQATVRTFIDLSSVDAGSARFRGRRAALWSSGGSGSSGCVRTATAPRASPAPADTGHLDLLIADGGSRRPQAARRRDRKPPAAPGRRRRGRAARRVAVRSASSRATSGGGFRASPRARSSTTAGARTSSTPARGRLDRRAYELCAAYELRSALRAGRVWVPGSRRHADPASLLLPDEQWQASRTEFARAVDQPLDGS